MPVSLSSYAAGARVSLRLAASLPTSNRHLIRWVEKMADLCQPERIHWIDGSEEEDALLKCELVNAGTFTLLTKPNDRAASMRGPRPTM